MDEILRRISHGETLKRVCASNPDFPSPATVIEWVHQDRCGLADRYARARDRQLEAWAEEVLDKADAASTDNGAVNRDRLAVDARKWLLSKLKPEKYGDRLHADITSGGKALASASDLDIAKALAHALQARALPPPEPIDVEAVPVKEGEP
jgi:terminase small subunit-like protein